MRSGFQDEITGEKETVTAENGISLVATVDSQVVGIAEAIFLNQEQAKPESYGLPAKMPLSTLDTMAVHPDFQHQGIAKALLAQLKRRQLAPSCVIQRQLSMGTVLIIKCRSG